MTKKNENFPVGAKVLSADFGQGVISAIEKIQSGGDDFYVVEYGKNKKSKNYFPTKGNKNIRQVSSKIEFEKSLELLVSSKSSVKMDSKKERQIYFDRPLEKNTIESIVIRIGELVSVSPLVPREQKILDRLTETLELENSIISDVTAEESKAFISGLLA
ncbi:hypothetical protein N9O57_01105 [bacterium]|nr:hypothetical protein [bacterium]